MEYKYKHLPFAPFEIAGTTRPFDWEGVIGVSLVIFFALFAIYITFWPPIV